jgi:hypothetical protein
MSCGIWYFVEYVKFLKLHYVYSYLQFRVLWNPTLLKDHIVMRTLSYIVIKTNAGSK